MSAEVAIFWLVALGFLLMDNCVLIPPGKDYLRFGRSGVLHYVSGSRQEIIGRELVLLNPLNLFQRAAITSKDLGPLGARQYLAARRMLRAALPRLNLFAWIGLPLSWPGAIAGPGFVPPEF